MPSQQVPINKRQNRSALSSPPPPVVPSDNNAAVVANDMTSDSNCNGNDFNHDDDSSLADNVVRISDQQIYTTTHNAQTTMNPYASANDDNEGGDCKSAGTKNDASKEAISSTETTAAKKEETRKSTDENVAAKTEADSSSRATTSATTSTSETSTKTTGANGSTSGTSQASPIDGGGGELQTINSKTTTTTVTQQQTTKPNGLKNRIIQRPPPLILDKVSNFYDTNQNNQAPKSGPSALEQVSSDVNISARNQQQQKHTPATQTQTQTHSTTTSTNRVNNDASNANGDWLQQQHHQPRQYTNTNQTANQKFWDSLNQNAASRNRSGTSRDQASHATRKLVAQHGNTVKDTITNSISGLGPDLVITHRSSSSSVAAPTMSQVSSISPPVRHEQQLKQHDNKVLDNPLEGLKIEVNGTASETNIRSDARSSSDVGNETQFTTIQKQFRSNGEKSVDPVRLHDMSNNSTEPDDTNVPSDGGNVIGVDNQTPPPVSDMQSTRYRINDDDDAQPPPSATSSRPRSSNPFLDEQDDDQQQLNHHQAKATSEFGKGAFGYGGDVSDSSDQQRGSMRNNFQKRPASFIAATHPNKSTLPKVSGTDHVGLPSSNGHSSMVCAPLPDAVQTQMSALRLNDGEYSSRANACDLSQRTQDQCDNPYSMKCNIERSTGTYGNPEVIYQSYNQAIYGVKNSHTNVTNSSTQLLNTAVTTSTSSNNPQYINHMVQTTPASNNYYELQQPVYNNQLPSANNQQVEAQQPIYGVYINHGYTNNTEQSISLDSESTVSKPPPSANMQLPHWSAAIYELNNAILETSSIVGGAENGQFIYLKDSGDIILELDHIKVSGFTLLEFNELVESKPVHLMSAVQTKHSQGLTTDLKNYLNLSFPKGSNDYQLQNLIRENIYRRTIPCTTRPPKKDEIDKVDYHFLTKEQFVAINNQGLLLECGTHGGHYYGTLKPLSNVTSHTQSQFTDSRQGISENQQHHWTTNETVPSLSQTGAIHPAAFNDDSSTVAGGMPLYENHESLRTFEQAKITTDIMQQSQVQLPTRSDPTLNLTNTLPMDYKDISNIGRDNVTVPATNQASSVLAVESESLPAGWECVIDRTHGTYYIDHNSQRTQYERPYEIELVKSSMGFGFTLVEAESGALLVRSVIPGGPAYQDGNIRPGDILISAIGVSVTGLPHTEVARLFSTFAIGNRVKLTFARTNFLMDENFEPDEYLFSNGTNGDMAIAINNSSSHYGTYDGPFPSVMVENPSEAEKAQILVNQEYEFISLNIRKGDQGFGFTISDSMAGQKVRKIQNNETCGNLKQGDVLVNLDGEDIIKMKHKEVVERLKNCPANKDVALVVKRKKRFRSKTPMTLTSRDENEFYSLDNKVQRNCKTPTLDTMMNPTMRTYSSTGPPLPPPPATRNLFYQDLQNPAEGGQHSLMSQPALPTQPIMQQNLYQNQAHTIENIYGYTQTLNPNTTHSDFDATYGTSRNMNGLTHLSQPSLGQNITVLNQVNQYNNFMNNDRLMMMQMQQRCQPPAPQQYTTSDYHQLPSVSTGTGPMSLPLPAKPTMSQIMYPAHNGDQNNFYANNEEIALQRVQAHGLAGPVMVSQQSIASSFQYGLEPNLSEEHDEYEYHQVELDRESTESNWGIRLIGGSEVDRAISIGSIVFGGAASKNGKLKSGDEIISINGMNVVGATHQHVVELISACTNRALLVIRRKKFAEACDVVLTRNMDEGFGFVIISSGNCALIGRIIEGSPADNCRQLHVRDRIIAVNGRYITPNMQHPEIVNMIKECGSTLRLRIIPVDCYTVELIKNAQNDNFGFSMRGGSEYDGTPLYILRVAPNGLAKDLLNVGDQIIEINNISTIGMTHQQAATIIKFSDPIVKLKLRRNHVTPPSLLVDSPRALQKFNQVTAEIKTVNPSSQSSGGTPNNLSQSDGGAGASGGSASSELGSSTAATTASLQQIPQQQQQQQQHEQQSAPQTILMDYTTTAVTTSAAPTTAPSATYNRPLYAT